VLNFEEAMGGTGLHFEVSGSGRVPLICIHGWACDGQQLVELSRRLANDFRIFRLDLPGHGRSPLAGLVSDFEGYAQRIAHFAQDHDLERSVLLGHSMGGILSMMAAGSGQLAPRAVINLDGSLPATEGPVLHIGSATPRLHAPKALTAIPHLKLGQIADTGHFLHIYAAERVAFMIRRFLATAISSGQGGLGT
jgi:pimeloyl-ACP methyl ester carboxylesterase